MIQHARARSAVAVLVLSVGAGCALAWTLSQPDRQPIVFALGLSWVMACAGGVTCQVFAVQDLNWFRLARWEENGRVYEWVGLRVFRWILLHTPLGWLGPLALRSSRSDLDRLLREMNSAEGRHAVAAVLSLAVAVAFALNGHMAIATWLVLITIPLNVYPMILQRWNRGRVLRLQRLLDGRKQSSGELRRDSVDT